MVVSLARTRVTRCRPLLAGATPRALGSAAVIALATVLGACTPPGTDGLPAPVVDATISAEGEGGGTAPTAATTDGATDGSDEPQGAAVLGVEGADGSRSWVSTGSTEVLSQVPLAVPLVAGDADFVQAWGPGEDRSYYVIITAPGRPAEVLAGIEAEYEAAGFEIEDIQAPKDGLDATGAAVFASSAYRVTVGLVPAGTASTTVTFAIVPRTDS